MVLFVKSILIDSFPFYFLLKGLFLDNIFCVNGMFRPKWSEEIRDEGPPNCFSIHFTDGQAIAKRLCSQISKTTNAVKQLVKEYARSQAKRTKQIPIKGLG